MKQHSTLIFVFLFFIFYSISAFAQDDESEVFAKKETIVYSFIPNEEHLQVNEKTTSVIIAKEDDISFTKVDFFDDESSIISSSVFTEKGKKLKVKAEEFPYEVDEYFYTDAYVSVLSFFMEEEGIERTVSVDKEFSDARYFTRVPFFTYYPVNEKVIQFVIPKDVSIELVEYNFDEYDIEKNMTNQGDDQVITYHLNDVKEFTSERRSLGSYRNLPHILVVPKSYSWKGNEQKIFSNTADLYGWYKSITDLVENEPDQITELTKRLISGINEDEEKVKVLYNWVQDNIRYIAFEDGIAGFKPDESQNVYKKKYGDCKGMANLLKEMLVIAGFDARLSWIGTKRLPYSYETPSLGVDNHMITTLFLNDNIYYLDPTDTFCPFGEVGFHIQDKEIMIENGEDYMVKRVPNGSYEDNLEQINIDFTLSDDLVLNGNSTHKYHGLSRTYLLQMLNSIDQSNLDKAIKSYLDDDEKNKLVNEIAYTNISEKEGIFKINYQLDLKNYISKFGNEMYVDLDSDKELDNMTIDDDRLTDYVMPHQLNREVSIQFNYPANYSIQHLPDPILISNDVFTIQADFKNTGQQITYSKRILINNGIIPIEKSDEWNAAIKQLGTFYEDSIILLQE